MKIVASESRMQTIRIRSGFVFRVAELLEIPLYHPPELARINPFPNLFYYRFQATPASAVHIGILTQKPILEVKMHEPGTKLVQTGA